MADPELEALRANRLAQMQQDGQPGSSEAAQKQAEQASRQEDMKNSILAQVLDQEARARLNTLSLAKPDKARMVESMICQMAQTGRIQQKLGEKELRGLLEKVAEQTASKTTVKFDRRRAALDSDSD